MNAYLPLRIKKGSMKGAFSASGKGKRATRRGGVLGAADTCARECVRKTTSQNVRSGRVPVLKKTIEMTLPGTAWARPIGHQRHGASSDVPPGTVAHITVCNFANMQRVIMAHMTACNINVALNAPLRTSADLEGVRCR